MLSRININFFCDIAKYLKIHSNDIEQYGKACSEYFNTNAIKSTMRMLTGEKWLGKITKLFASVFIQGKMPPKGAEFYETKSLSLSTKDSSIRLDSEEKNLKRMTIKIVPGAMRFIFPK